MAPDLIWNAALAAEVNHFDGVVFQSGHEQALRPDIHGQVIGVNGGLAI